MTDDINKLNTGVPGLDALLGGGLPEFSFNIVGGAPGAGKTTFCQQIMFALANSDRRAIFFTALGEPPLKMLRYQRQFKYFDTDKVEESIRFINLGAEVLDGDFEKVLARIVQEVKDFSPSYVFVDSFRSIINKTVDGNPHESSVQKFVQHLAILMTNWQATTFLIGEYDVAEAHSNPIFTIADCIIWFSQNFDRNAMVRKISVLKLRGQSQITGLHTYHITDAGVEIFLRGGVHSRQPSLEELARNTGPMERLSFGKAPLDQMMGGGLPAGYTMLIVGPSGAGKTILGTEFIIEGIKRGEPGLMISFEKPPQIFYSQITEGVKAQQVSVMDMHAMDLTIDEMLNAICKTIDGMQIKRVLFDSLSGFEMALAPEFRNNLRDSMYRLTSTLNAKGVTVVMTSELEDRYTDLRFSQFGSAFLVDGIVLLRYVELNAELRRIINVVKLRGSQHSKGIYFYDIDDRGFQLGESVANYEGMLTGRAISTNSDSD